MNPKDAELLKRLPAGKWFAAGALSIHPAKLNRLVRLGVLKRRYCLIPKMSRTWDYLRVDSEVKTS